MRVLFVSSGNKGISPIIRNQGESLVKEGVSVDYFGIVGKGLLGYLSNVPKLRKKYKLGKYDIVHAHYSLTAFIASIAMASPLVVSLMGSDVKKGMLYRLLIKIFAFFFDWKNIIVKSEDMKKTLNIKRTMVIPNGVDMTRFYEMNQSDCRRKLGWSNSKKHILFPANISRPEKNFELLRQASSLLTDLNCEIHWFNNIPNNETPFWYNAADVVVMTSLWEGSPNAIKEAMACNRPIVSTDVGDVKWMIGNLDGCFLSEYTDYDLVNKIKSSFLLSCRTNGRDRIIDLGLSNDLIAKRLMGIYELIIGD